jgi:adenylate kinase
MNIVLFGAPGVGKGTQAQIIAERNNLAHLSTGDEFRRNIKEQTELGVKVKEIVDSGALVPDSMVTDIVRSALNATKFDAGCVFDGFPRTITQAEDLDIILSQKQSSIALVIDINVPEDEIVQRLLSRGRADDTEEVIRHRLNVYHEQTAPVLDYYRAKNSLVSIDGNASVEEVYDRINTHLLTVNHRA